MKTLTFKEAVRYLISAAGMIIGIFIFIVVLEIVEGGRSVLNDYFWSNGVKVYDIGISDKTIANEDYLQWEDGRLLEAKMNEVKGSIAVLKLTAQLKSYKASETVNTLAVNERYLQYANLEMQKGSFIIGQDVKTANKIAVIDDVTALELFGTSDIIGQKLDIQVGSRKVEFVVAGVFRNFNRNIETLFDDEIPGLCLIPDTVPLDVSFDFDMEKLIALVDNKLHKEETVAMLGHLLEKEHGVTAVYSIDEYKQLPQVSAFADKYLVFSVITAMVGLISGGIGVMNAMLLSIQERNKEIGLYKLFGSGIKELQYDIIYRTLILCISFGILGLVLGVMAGSFIGSFINIPARFTMISIFFTITASVAAGISSSLYPASKIKRVNASEAIWSE